MKIAFYGSSLLSSYWNGAAAYYRGILKALARRGYDITFYEPDVHERQSHRDIEPPDWCKVVVYPGTLAAMREAAAKAAAADIVVKASGVGFEDDALMAAVFEAARPDALKIWWDVDAPETLAQLHANPDHPLHRHLKEANCVFAYGGGPQVVSAYRALGARDCVTIYNALDPETHYPVAAELRFAAGLAFLGNRMPDREARVETYFLEPAAQLPEFSFLLGGAGWGGRPMPNNISYIGHVSTLEHNAFNVSPKTVLNVNRAGMASVGYSPPTRVFEAAGAGACLITDEWPGIELFFKPNEEILVARDGNDVLEMVRAVALSQARAIGRRALKRVRRDHTYARRAQEADGVIRRLRDGKRTGAAA